MNLMQLDTLETKLKRENYALNKDTRAKLQEIRGLNIIMHINLRFKA
jgi:homoserine trans-succinylase